MRVHPQKIVARLTPAAKRHLERAVGRAVESQHAEITPEHVLLAMLEEPKGDAECLLRALEREPRTVSREVEGLLRRFRTGSPSKPRLSEALSRWLTDAWSFASLEWSDSQLRSAALLATIIRDPSRYLSDPLDALSGIDSAQIEASREALALSIEQVESSASASSSPSAAPASTAALDRFTRSFVDDARAGRIDPIFGREREVRQVIDVLSRRRKNNPILVGEPGVGKSALVEGLALAIVNDEVPESLRGVDIRGLDLGLLEAGASVKGEFEQRLQSVIRETQASPRPIILFIDEAHTLIGAGNQKGGADAANLLKPALARGELRTIAATTWSEYKQYFEKDAALERRFQPVKVEEPSEEVAIGMLRGLRTVYERAHDVVIRDEAIEAAVRLGHRYLTGRQLPDKAVDLLDTTAARVRVDRSAKPDRLAALDAQIASLGRRIDAIARDLADAQSEDAMVELMKARKDAARLEAERTELTARWNAQREALVAALEARRTVHESAKNGEARDRIETLESRAKEALDTLRKTMAEDALVSVDVDHAAVARTIELWTGVPIGAMQGDTSRAVLALGPRLQERVMGQDAALERIAESLRVAQAGLRTNDGPMGIFLLVGPSGVGKTETAHAISDLLFGGDRFLTTINLSEYQEAHTATRLVGSPPSYVGYGEGGELTEAIRQKPYSVLLLDECEKAAIEVMNTFYRVFDKGLLADSEGRIIDFRNTCILLTSNLASDLVVQCAERGMSLEDIEQAITPALSKHFKPALLHRMTIVPYGPLGETTVRRIIEGELTKVAKRVEEVHGSTLEADASVVDWVLGRCTEVEGGVRHVRRMLERSLLTPLSTRLLSEQTSGARFRATIDGSGALSLEAS
jgi:type VI secretion system protein VasG